MDKDNPGESVAKLLDILQYLGVKAAEAQYMDGKFNLRPDASYIDTFVDRMRSGRLGRYHASQLSIL